MYTRTLFLVWVIVAIYVKKKARTYCCIDHWFLIIRRSKVCNVSWRWKCRQRSSCTRRTERDRRSWLMDMIECHNDVSLARELILVGFLFEMKEEVFWMSDGSQIYVQIEEVICHDATRRIVSDFLTVVWSSEISHLWLCQRQLDIASLTLQKKLEYVIIETTLYLNSRSKSVWTKYACSCRRSRLKSSIVAFLSFRLTKKKTVEL